MPQLLSITTSIQKLIPSTSRRLSNRITREDSRDVPDIFNFQARTERTLDGDTMELTLDVGYGLHQTEHPVRPQDIDSAETWRPKNDREREIGEAQKRWAEDWLRTAREDHDGDWPLILDSQEWKTDSWERSLGYLYRKSDGHEYTEDFLDEWGEQYRYR